MESERIWEYREFIYQAWKPQDTWSSLTTQDCYLIPQARLFFWQLGKENIRSELQKWQSAGWEPVDIVGPNSIKLDKHIENEQPGVDIADVLMWIITFGVALIIELLNDSPARQYTIYRPLPLQMQMRRHKRQ